MQIVHSFKCAKIVILYQQYYVHNMVSLSIFPYQQLEKQTLDRQWSIILNRKYKLVMLGHLHWFQLLLTEIFTDHRAIATPN